ncbi:MAG: GTP 3',8-cyclase MoaA [Desulfovibrionaceae bacterium]|nr:GTP 3',8-cyclase MoaA [Desulfovibrionaceae bacterium]
MPQSSLHDPRASLCDDLGRTVRYVRISITDRCNLRCKYCQSNAQTCYIPHDNILQYEEILRIVKILHGLGVAKVRLTGGEPFARKGCPDLISLLRTQFPNLDLRITSNGTLLQEHVPMLKKFHVNAVNLSLDTFDAQVFTEITGANLLGNVLNSLDALLAANIQVKLNAVALRGITQPALDDFIYAATSLGIDVRFIEFMPIGHDTAWSKDLFCPVADILALAWERVPLQPVSVDNPLQGPARMFEIKGKRGRLGFISPISNHFCHTCNRLRLTSDGYLRLCLYDDQQYPLRTLMREEKLDDLALAEKIKQVIRTKPLGIHLLQARKQQQPVAQRTMSGIGG